ncbi:MAG: squalene/phytoene synthase family protein [bacterium]
MSQAPDIEEIMRKGDKFVYHITKTLPIQIQNLLFRLNAFIYICNTYCNTLPQQKESFFDLKEKFFNFRNQSRILFDATPVELEDEDFIIESFVNLEGDLKFDFTWTENFFKSIDLNFDKKTYSNFAELNNYIDLSSGSIALFLCKIFEVKQEAFAYIQKLVEAFEIVKIIQNIPKNNRLNRNYLPQQLMMKYGLKSLEYKDLVLQDRDFTSFIKEILGVYNLYLTNALKGSELFPKQYQGQIQAFIDYYQNLAIEFQKEPMLILTKRNKIKSFGKTIKGIISSNFS